MSCFGLINDFSTIFLQDRIGFQPILKIFSFSQYGKYYPDEKLLINNKIINSF